MKTQVEMTKTREEAEARARFLARTAWAVVMLNAEDREWSWCLDYRIGKWVCVCARDQTSGEEKFLCGRDTRITSDVLEELAERTEEELLRVSGVLTGRRAVEVDNV